MRMMTLKCPLVQKNRQESPKSKQSEQRKAMRELGNLPITNNGQVTLEEKGSRFVIQNLDHQDNLILNQLSDVEHFDRVPSDPTECVKVRISNFCDKWGNDLNTFHPKTIHFLTDLGDSKFSTVKDLVKCHKKPRPDGKHDI